jgi:hypothetical protein
MIDRDFARAHRDNIICYRRLLDTRLPELERFSVKKRLDEEEVVLQALSKGVSADRHLNRACCSQMMTNRRLRERWNAANYIVAIALGTAVWLWLIFWVADQMT